MKNRKQEEASFHNKIRSRELKSNNSEHRYLTSNKKFYSVARKSRNFVLNFLKENCKDKKFLDYCCGDGDVVLYLGKQGARAVGIDISSTSIQNAKEKAEKEGLANQTSFLVMDAENLNFEENYFDLILCNGVLHHLNVKKAYPELARVLKPNGKIICAEPLVYNPVFQLYRKMTPHLRTKWESKHILSKKEIDMAKEHFGKVETNFFHLAVLAAVPFRRLLGFNFILRLLEAVDSVLLKIPVFRWLSWQIVYILSKPKK